MSILLRPAHNIENYDNDLHRNHDKQVSHLADEVAHNLRFAAFGWHTDKRIGFAKTELEYDSKHLSSRDFKQELAEIKRRLPNRDVEIHKNKHGAIEIRFDHP